LDEAGFAWTGVLKPAFRFQLAEGDAHGDWGDVQLSGETGDARELAGDAPIAEERAEVSGGLFTGGEPVVGRIHGCQLG
jgi:hypothetical protein